MNINTLVKVDLNSRFNVDRLFLLCGKRVKKEA